jgi:DNA-binding CsgD family transcriptional regulator
MADVGSAPRVTGGLLERTRELELLRRAADAATAGDGRILMVEGEAGIGKTALLAEAGRAAGERGFRVLYGRGGELERDFAFGVARQLFESHVVSLTDADQRRVLAGAASLAAPLLGLAQQGDRPASPDAAFAVSHGLYWLTANLADREPLVLVVDDAHWADAATLQLLAYLGRRLAGVHVLILLGLRPAESGGLLDAIAELDVAEKIRPRHLSIAASAAIVERGLGDDADEAFRAACYELTGGNPFLLEELLRSYAAEPTDESSTPIARLRRLGPRPIARRVLGRIGSLLPEAVEMARAVAVLGAEAELRHAAALTGLGEREAAAAGDALTEAQILAVGQPLRFIHPVVRQAIYEDLGPRRRSSDHARAARLLAAEGVDPQHVALHLLAAEPAADEWVVERLTEAADHARAQGSPPAAAALLQRALAEPPPRDRRAPLLIALGVAGLLARHESTIDWFAQAVDAAGDPDTATLAALGLGNAAAMRGEMDRAWAAIYGRAPGASGASPDVARLSDAQARGFAVLLVDGRARAAACGWDLADHAPPPGDTPAERIWLVQAAWTAVMRNQPAADALALVERALASGTLLAETRDFGWSTWFAPHLLGLCGLYDRALEFLDHALRDAHARHSLLAIEGMSAARGALYLRLGRPRDAEVDAEASLGLSDVRGWALGLPFKLSVLVDALLMLGDLPRARQMLVAYGLDAGDPQRDLYGMALLLSRGRLLLAEGRPDDALADFLRCDEWLTKMQFRDAANVPWRLGAALAHHAGGDQAEARRLADEQLELARAFGEPVARATALRSRVAVAEAPGEHLQPLREALATLDGTNAPLERALTLVDLGRALRHAGQRRQARQPLEQGMELAHRCHAVGLREQAREELRVLGARPRRFVVSGVDALTASERRVAELAADGLTNREIAQALFVTHKTVEFHLSRIYQKLDITSRGELGRALSLG